MTLPAMPTTAMDRVGIRRLILYIEKSIRAFGMRALFETSSERMFAKLTCGYAKDLLGACYIQKAPILGHSVHSVGPNVYVSIQLRNEDWINLKVRLHLENPVNWLVEGF